MKQLIILLSFLATAALAAPTNNPTPQFIAVTTDANGVLAAGTASANLFLSNSAALIAALTNVGVLATNMPVMWTNNGNVFIGQLCIVTNSQGVTSVLINSNGTIVASGAITAASFAGNGSALTSLPLPLIIGATNMVITTNGAMIFMSLNSTNTFYGDVVATTTAGTNINLVLTNIVTGATAQSLTFNNKGLITGGGALTAAMIPGLAGSNINSGTVLTNYLPPPLAALATNNGINLTNLPGSSINSGTVATNYLPANLAWVAQTAHPLNEVAGAYCVDGRNGTPAYLYSDNTNCYLEVSRVPYYSTRIPIQDIQLLYNNPTMMLGPNISGFSPAQTISTNPLPLSIAAMIEYPSNSFHVVTFGGALSNTCPTNGVLLSDDIPVNIPPNTPFWIRTFVATVGNTNTAGYLISQYQNSPLPPNDMFGGSPYLAQCTRASNNLSYANITNATFGTGGHFVFCYTPSAVLGYNQPVSFGLIGDSISVTAVNASSSAPTFCGYFAAAINTNFPTVIMDYYGNWMAYEVTNSNPHASVITNGCNIVVSQLGINDVDNLVSFSTMTNNYAIFWGMCASNGVKVYQTTLIPHASSTDGWTTTNNQAHSGGGFNESVRLQINNWIRSCPAPLSGYFEMADLLESSRDSGWWKTNGAVSNYYTADGLHPTALAAGIMSGAVSNWLTQFNPTVVPNAVYAAATTLNATLTNGVSFDSPSATEINLSMNSAVTLTNVTPSATASGQFSKVTIRLIPNSLISYALTVPTNWLFQSPTLAPTNVAYSNILEIVVERQLSTATNYFATLNRYSWLAPLDTNAASFFTASGITDPVIKAAVDLFVINAKTNGYWSNLIAAYPLVGGTTNAEKWNLVNTNTDALVWANAGAAFSLANGYKSSGAVGDYVNTGIIDSGSFFTNANSWGLGLWISETNLLFPSAGIWKIAGAGYNYTGGALTHVAGPNGAPEFNVNSTHFGASESYWAGFFAENVLGGTNSYMTSSTYAWPFASGQVTSSPTFDNGTIQIPASGGGFVPMSNNVSFIAVWQGMTSNQVITLKSDIATFETNLSR